MKPTYEELEQQLSESRREFWAADATINNLEMKLTEMAERLANAESRMESAEKLIDTLRQDKDKVIDMSIERVNKLLSRAEAAEQRIAELESLNVPRLPQPAVTHDAATAIRACLDEFPEGVRDIVEECADIAENACRAAMLQGAEPVTDNANQQFESLSRGDK